MFIKSTHIFSIGIISLTLIMPHIFAAERKLQKTAIVEKATDKLSEPYVGKVTLARKLIGSTITSSSGQSFGKIEEIVIDIGSGKVQSVFMAPAVTADNTDLGKDTLLIPYSSLQCSEKDSNCFTIPKLPEGKDKKTSEANSDSRLLMVSKIKSIEIRDKADKLLGYVHDFALEQGNDKVAYAVVTSEVKDEAVSDSSKYYAIPLAAFLVQKDVKSWLLELPEDSLKNTPKFSQDKLPSNVDGSWTEYVHVRYGRAVLGGVQSESAKKTDRDK